MQCCHALFQTVGPIWYFDTKGLLNFRLVKYRISRTYDWAGKFITMTWQNITICMTRQTSYFFRKIKPRTNPFVAEMIDTLIAIELTVFYDI